MARILITGSADGLGHLAAKELVARGHEVILHARSESRVSEALEQVPGAMNALAADLADIQETKRLAAEAKAHGPYDAIIHNAAVYRTHAEDIFTVNTLAPYILTCLIEPPRRLIYMSSGLHMQGEARLESFVSEPGAITYSDSKLHMVMLAKAIARRLPHVYSNAVDPGWVPTKMGGADAPDELGEGIATQVWLATSDEPKALVSARYFHHKEERASNSVADEEALQDRFLQLCGEITGVGLAVTA